MQRDIPLHQIEAGLDKGNLRELVHKKMQSDGLRNPTIRFREIGHFTMRSKQLVDVDSIQSIRREYAASDGKEFFLSFEIPDVDVILAFLRLRLPSDNAHRPEIFEESCSLIRELRVYGPVVEIGERDPQAWQHLGLGEKLLTEAERISHDELGVDRILVNSGIGVKEYYRNLGFANLGPFLAKDLG
jgi:elongator complex protein 3